MYTVGIPTERCEHRAQNMPTRRRCRQGDVFLVGVVSIGLLTVVNIHTYHASTSMKAEPYEEAVLAVWPPPAPSSLPAANKPVLPTNVTCIELHALRNCLGEGLLPAPWAPSADVACRDRGISALPPESCQKLLERRRAASPLVHPEAARRGSGTGTSTRPDWSDTAFGIPIYNSKPEEEILEGE